MNSRIFFIVIVFSFSLFFISNLTFSEQSFEFYKLNDNPKKCNEIMDLNGDGIPDNLKPEMNIDWSYCDLSDIEFTSIESFDYKNSKRPVWVDGIADDAHIEIRSTFDRYLEKLLHFFEIPFDAESTYYSGINLKTANLEGANLQNVKLVESNMRFSNLNNVNAQNGNFAGTNFHYALLNNSNFSNSDFSHAMLYLAEMQNANFSGADLSFANLCDFNTDTAPNAIKSHNVDFQIPFSIKHILLNQN